MKVKTLHRYRREVAHLSNIRSTVAASTQGDDYIFFPIFSVSSASAARKNRRDVGEKSLRTNQKFSWNFFSGPLGEQMCELDTCRNGAEADFLSFCFVLRARSAVLWHPSARVEQVEQVSMFQLLRHGAIRFPYRHFGKSQMRFLRSN